MITVLDVTLCRLGRVDKITVANDQSLVGTYVYRNFVADVILTILNCQTPLEETLSGLICCHASQRYSFLFIVVMLLLCGTFAKLFL